MDPTSKKYQLHDLLIFYNTNFMTKQLPGLCNSTPFRLRDLSASQSTALVTLITVVLHPEIVRTCVLGLGIVTVLEE